MSKRKLRESELASGAIRMHVAGFNHLTSNLSRAELDAIELFARLTIDETLKRERDRWATVVLDVVRFCKSYEGTNCTPEYTASMFIKDRMGLK